MQATSGISTVGAGTATAASAILAVKIIKKDAASTQSGLYAMVARFIAATYGNRAKAGRHCVGIEVSFSH
jgi:hypothetical protein